MNTRRIIRGSLREITIPIRRSRHLRLSFALLFLMAGLLSQSAKAAEDNAPSRLQCEAMQEPLGIDISHPRLSWLLQDFEARCPADGV